LVEILRNELDGGEAEAIALAVELEADQILIDERRGRIVAARINLKYVGILGILALNDPLAFFVGGIGFAGEDNLYWAIR
jgi:predicted nucleic acid-binding protein